MNTLSILSLSTPLTYLVESKTGDKKEEYVVNTKKRTCTCAYGTHQPKAIVNNPCKHLVFCLNVEGESILKNYIHFHLVSVKQLPVVKVSKITRIIKNNKPTKIVAASYVLSNGNKGCLFVNTVDIPRQGYFEIYEKEKNPETQILTLKVSITEKIVTSARFSFGNQFDLIFTGGYTKRVMGHIGWYSSEVHSSVYDAMTAFLMPENTNYRHAYLEYLTQECQKNNSNYDDVFQYNGIQLWFVRNKNAQKSITSTITFSDDCQVKEYKKISAAFK